MLPRRLLPLCALFLILPACSSEDDPRFIIDFDAGDDASDTAFDGAGPGRDTDPGTDTDPGMDTDPGTDTDPDAPGPRACDPPCDVLGREACDDGVCGPCLDGLEATGGIGGICCGPGEVPSSDGLSCNVAPECEDVACLNGGQCVVVDGYGVCDCPSGTTGRSCDAVCDAGPLTPVSCSIDGIDCIGLFDGTWTFGPSCTNDSPFCEYDDGDCSGGCIRVPIDLDMGADVQFTDIWWQADWWTKRPERVLVQVASDASFSDAETVVELTGNEAPYQCVTGEPCGGNVPDACCPDGRDQPQRIAEGALISLYDIHAVRAGYGRYWRVLIDNTYSPADLILVSMQTFGHGCPGGLGCDPAVENCGPPPSSVYRVLDIGSTDWDSAVGAASSDVINGVRGLLASVTSTQESDEVTQMMRQLSRPIWFGLYQDTGAADYVEPDRGWRWLSGEPFSFENWGGGEPNDSAGREHWGLLLGNGAWNDQSISSPPDAIGALVEYPADELQPAINPDNGNAYLRVNARFDDFGDAENHARSLWFRGVQGHLVTITSEAEQQWIGNNLGWSYLWIGMYQDLSASDYEEPGGGWRWVTGEDLTYTNWGDGEPNDDRGMEHFASTYAGGEWNDNVQNWNYTPRNEGYIVEFELNP